MPCRFPKMRNKHFSDHYSSLGAHLSARDRKAVRRTVSGMVKILCPHGEVSQEDLAEILELAIEGWRRVKEQLKNMGSFEYSQVSFSYLLGNRVPAEIGVAFFVAACSMLRKAPPLPALLVLGDMSIPGSIKPIRSLVEPLQVAMDNGSRRRSRRWG